MAVLARTPVASKRHVCNRCGHWIQPGTRYRTSALTPNSDLGNLGWWHEKECATCAEACGRPIPAETRA